MINEHTPLLEKAERHTPSGFYPQTLFRFIVANKDGHRQTPRPMSAIESPVPTTDYTLLSISRLSRLEPLGVSVLQSTFEAIVLAFKPRRWRSWPFQGIQGDALTSQRICAGE